MPNGYVHRNLTLTLGWLTCAHGNWDMIGTDHYYELPLELML